MGFFVRTIQCFEWIFKLEFLKLLSSKWIIMHSTQLECINYSLACWFFQFGLSCDSSEPWMLFPLSRFFPLSLAISLFCPTFEPSYSIYLSVLPPDPHSSSLSPCQPAPSSLLLFFSLIPTVSPLSCFSVVVVLFFYTLNHSPFNVNSNCLVREDITVPIIPKALRGT